MASHGKKRHMKRLAAPAAHPILRKEHLWLAVAKPGAHAQSHAVPLIVLLRDVLKVATDTREAQKIASSGQVLVDGRVVSDLKLPVGLTDVVSLPKLNASFIVVNVKGKLAVRKEASKGGSKLCKVTGKRLLSKDKVQLSTHDGRTLVVSDKKYAVGDTVRIAVPKQTILEHLPLAKGARCYVFQGRHAGTIGKLEEIVEFPGITRSNAKIAGEGGSGTTTLKEYVFVVDKEFSV